MAKPAICKETIKKNVVADMKKFGTFKAEYEGVIDVYCEMMEQYIRLTKEYKEGGYRCETTTDNGSVKKAPIVATLESLRKDILQYSDRLCLNPKANMPEPGEGGGGGQSLLARTLMSLET